MLPLFVFTRRFHAITLFPFVFYNDKPLTEKDRRHETVHVWQQLALLLVIFYILYLIFWLVGYLRYRDVMRAYYAIPFERSAYHLESHINLKPSTLAFHWIKYIIH